MIILDTNIISEIMRPVPKERVMAWLRQQSLSSLAIMKKLGDIKWRQFAS